MAVVVVATGLDRLDRLAKVLRANGDKQTIRTIEKGLRKQARPLLKSARQGALQILPYRGGLAERVARSRFTSQVRLGSGGVTLTIRGRGQYNLNRMDEGHNRHPVHAHGPRTEWAWVDQTIRPGWFTDPLLLDAPGVRDAVDKEFTELGRAMEAAV